MLPVGGYPSAVLGALRAANRNQETILATSDDPSDDELAQQASSHGLKVFRGPLHDVLARYYLASANLAEDDAVIRLTADNLLPDGQFAAELTEAFASTGKDYLSADSVLTGLPYGLDAEAFSVSALRRAHRQATEAFDREHVGPWIKRNCNSAVYRPRRADDSDFTYLRCTIDDEDDYRRIVCLFEDVRDPIRVRWQDLVQKLARLPGEPKFRVPYRVNTGRIRSRLVLGTAQLGMDYGAVNEQGRPSVEQAVAMVRKAIAHGVTALDTARAYGTSEEVIGTALKGAWASRVEVITKLDLSDLRADATTAQAGEGVDESIRRSCEALGSKRLQVLLLHRWQDRYSWHGAAWEHLLHLRAEGKISVLGASVYEPSEALEALADPTIEHLQIPMNVLDWRWEAAGIDRAALARPEVVVHARSALLQGVLAHPAKRWPEVDGLCAHECARILKELNTEFQRESVTDFCLAYVRSLPWVTSVVVGCETIEQLDENLRLFRTPELTQEQCVRARREIPRAPENFLNPSKWKVLHEPSAAR